MAKQLAEEAAAVEPKPWWETEAVQAQVTIMEIGEFLVDCINDEIFPSRYSIPLCSAIGWSYFLPQSSVFLAASTIVSSCFRPYVVIKVGRNWQHHTYALNLKQR